MAAASLDFKEELSAMLPSNNFRSASSSPSFKNGPMTALLSLAVGGSMQNQMEAKLASMKLKVARTQVNHVRFPSASTFNTSTTSRQLLAFDRSSSFLSPDTANTVGNPSNATMLAQHRAKLKAVGKTVPRISVPALAPSGERAGLGMGSSARSSRPQSTDFSGLSASSAFRSPRPDGGTAPGGLEGFSPVVGDRWASMVNTPLLPMFQKTPSANNNNAGLTVDLAGAKSNDLYGSSNVPRLDDPDKFRRPFKGHVHDSSSSSSDNGVTNNGDLIQGHHAPGVGRVQSGSSRGLRNGGGGTWSGGKSAALSNTFPRKRRRKQRNGCGASTSGAGWRQDGRRRNKNMLNLAAMGVSPAAQLLAAQIAAAGGGFSQSGPGVGAGLGTFGGLQAAWAEAAVPVAKEDRQSAGIGGAKKDEEDFEPAVPNDVAKWLPSSDCTSTRRTEGVTWKETHSRRKASPRSVCAGRCSRLSRWFARRWHRRPDCASPSATAVVWRTGTGGTGLDLGGLGWQWWWAVRMIAPIKEKNGLFVWLLQTKRQHHESLFALCPPLPALDLPKLFDFFARESPGYDGFEEEAQSVVQAGISSISSSVEIGSVASSPWWRVQYWRAQRTVPSNERAKVETS
ncbi:hypothetical protein EDB85DRAFT_2201912 [Lactarius pseudohatsudake]|nr:hypothetical protein EDB85DRAFT_2201912 [Lactarius pseudohatsudake]